MNLPLVAKSAAGVMVPCAVVVDATDQVLVSPATAVSLDARFSVPVLAFSVAENVSAEAIGLMAVTLMVTVAVDEWPDPSVIVYVNESVPLKPALGVYMNLPLVAKSAAGVMVPCAVVVDATDQVLVSPATAVSLDARFSVPVLAFSVAENVSAEAIGLMAVTLMVTVAVDEWPDPSVIVYVNESVPLKPALGVYVNLPLVAKSAAGVMLPCAVVVEATDQVLVSPATAVSLDARLSVPVVAFSVAENESFVATGLIAATLIVTVAVEEWPDPSVIV